MAKTFIFLLAGEGRRQLDEGVLIKNVWKAANRRNITNDFEVRKKIPTITLSFLAL